MQLAGTSTTDADGLSAAISDTEPRYSFFRYTHHDAEGLKRDSLVFIYTCPSSSKIKERMVYASSKLTFLNAVESELGVEIARKVSHFSPFVRPIFTQMMARGGPRAVGDVWHRFEFSDKGN